jgi:hypothetical protein
MSPLLRAAVGLMASDSLRSELRHGRMLLVLAPCVTFMASHLQDTAHIGVCQRVPWQQCQPAVQACVLNGALMLINHPTQLPKTNRG